MLIRGVDAPASSILFWSSAFGLVIAVVAGWAMHGRLSWRLLVRVSGAGALLSASVLTGFLSVQNTSIMHASLIDSMDPLLLLIGVPIVMKSRLGRRPVAFAVLALGGSAMLVLGAGGSSGATFGGDAWAVLSLMLWIGYFVLVQRYRDAGVDTASLLASIFIVGFLISAPLALVMDPNVGSVGGRDLFLIGLVALVPGCLAYGLTAWAQRYLDLRITSLIGLVSPVASAVGAWIIFAEHLGAVEIVGAAVVLAGLAGIVGDPDVGTVPTDSRRRPLSESPEPLLS